MTIRLDIVTAERVVFSEDVDILVAPGILGQLGILHYHTPLMTTLEPGELLVRKSGEEISMAISGGFIEVRSDRIIVLADAAERADEIDLARAEAAKSRAQQQITRPPPEIDLAQAEAALRRALARLRVAEKRKKKNPIIT